LCLFVAGSSGGGFLRLSHLWREFQELEMATGWFLYSNFHVSSYCLMSKMFERSYKSIIFYLLDIKLINIIFLSFFHWATIIIYKIEVKYYSN
jgi:hypothetical protein